MQKVSPKVILETGTARGGTLSLFTRVASPEAIITSIDLPDGMFDGRVSCMEDFILQIVCS
ncbi:MAG: hypothetical protein ACP5KW_10020 [Thermoproteota archaeon]